MFQRCEVVCWSSSSSVISRQPIPFVDCFTKEPTGPSCSVFHVTIKVQCLYPHFWEQTLHCRQCLKLSCDHTPEINITTTLLSYAAREYNNIHYHNIDRSQQIHSQLLLFLEHIQLQWIIAKTVNRWCCDIYGHRKWTRLLPNRKRSYLVFYLYSSMTMFSGSATSGGSQLNIHVVCINAFMF